jgi:hypothetical protein
MAVASLSVLLFRYYGYPLLAALDKFFPPPTDRTEARRDGSPVGDSLGRVAGDSEWTCRRFSITMRLGG